MKCDYVGSNCFFIDHDNCQYCFSYGKLVAEINNGKYIEHDGDKYYSHSSNCHKSKFRNYYGVKK